MFTVEFAPLTTLPGVMTRSMPSMPENWPLAHEAEQVE